MKANEITTVLNHFKDSRSDYKRVLIDGTWGIGKTRYVSEFKKDHKHACFVSLFGKKI
ncbi:ATP-binding protein [Bacillus sp. EB93]|nr:ATP-binding protein [Peribacillus frigoritolerans]